MVNAHVLLAPMTSREAVLSSRIEGTQASLIEVLEFEAGRAFEQDSEKRKDIHEIINYRMALIYGETQLKQRPISLSLIRELHQMLMSSVRGEDKEPGQFRTIQNWIGKPGSTIDQARFIPPDIPCMTSALTNFETFTATDYDDPLIQLALLHAQFEIIHPFNDGNGRLGRMLIPLFLYQKNVLQSPVFYLSEYLEQNDRAYRDRLLAITEQGDWQGWVEFFLQAIRIQADWNADKARKIHTLYEQMKIQFAEATKSKFSVLALDAFFASPIIDSSKFREMTTIPNATTAHNVLKALEKASLIYTIREGQGRRPAIYIFPEIINIAEGRDVFKDREKG